MFKLFVKITKMMLHLALLIFMLFQLSMAQLNDTIFVNREQILANIFTGYNKINKPPGKTIISIDVNLLQVVNVIEKDQVIVLNTWINQVWNDKRLSWNPQLYDNLSYVAIPSDKIWT